MKNHRARSVLAIMTFLYLVPGLLFFGLADDRQCPAVSTSADQPSPALSPEGGIP